MHFEKGIDPNITIEALKRAALLIIEITGGEISSKLVNLQAKTFEHFKVNLRYEQLNKLAGIKFEIDEVKSILRLLEIKIDKEDKNGLELLVPPYRADVQREADVIEDVMRIYGFNNIPIPTKLNASVNASSGLSSDDLYEKVAGYFSRKRIFRNHG